MHWFKCIAVLLAVLATIGSISACEGLAGNSGKPAAERTAEANKKLHQQLQAEGFTQLDCTGDGVVFSECWVYRPDGEKKLALHLDERTSSELFVYLVEWFYAMGQSQNIASMICPWPASTTYDELKTQEPPSLEGLKLSQVEPLTGTYGIVDSECIATKHNG